MADLIIKKMDIGEASRIFRDLDNPAYDDLTKISAIYRVINMETHNSITKVELLKALRWMYNGEGEDNNG